MKSYLSLLVLLHSFNELNQDDVSMQALFELNLSVFVLDKTWVGYLLHVDADEHQIERWNYLGSSGCIMSGHRLNTFENHNVL